MALYLRLCSAAAVVGALAAGCSRGPAAFEPPDVDVESAAAQAMELYDGDNNGALSREELAKCPGVLGKLTAYDRNGDGAVDQMEIQNHLSELLKNGVGGTQLNCLVLYQGKALAGADVVLEPEPYLGANVQAATGVTNGSGAVQLGIPPEYLPAHLQRLKAVHYGTFKVRITHPTTKLPEKYNTETELGYETEPGNPMVRFDLK